MNMRYPNDTNGDALRRMEDSGDDLSRPRNIDFTVVFPNGDAAEEFANHSRALGYVVSVESAQTDEEFPWDVVVINHIVPTHEAIGTFEDSLQHVASSLGGHNDGWGCLAVPPPPSSN